MVFHRVEDGVMTTLYYIVPGPFLYRENAGKNLGIFLASWWFFTTNPNLRKCAPAVKMGEHLPSNFWDENHVEIAGVPYDQGL